MLDILESNGEPAGLSVGVGVTIADRETSEEAETGAGLAKMSNRAFS